MLSDIFGPPQIAALLILLQRGLEELHSQRNTRRLLQQGAQEAGRDYYPVVAATHLAWIASLAFLVPPSASVYLLPLIAFLALQPVRYWIIGTLALLLDPPHHHARRSADRDPGPLSFREPSQLRRDAGRNAAPAARVRPAGARHHLHHRLGGGAPLQDPSRESSRWQSGAPRTAERP